MDDDDSGLSNSPGEDEEESGFSEGEVVGEVEVDFLEQPPFLVQPPEKKPKFDHDNDPEASKGHDDDDDPGGSGGHDRFEMYEERDSDDEEPRPSTSSTSIAAGTGRTTSSSNNGGNWTLPMEFMESNYGPNTVGEAMQNHARSMKSRNFDHLGHNEGQEGLDDVGNNRLIERIPLKTNDVTTMVVHQNDMQFFNVDYPAIVENPENAVRTLGGIEVISHTFNTNLKKKLRLKFRPGDPFCNSTPSDEKMGCGLLIRIRKRKTPSTHRQNQNTGGQVSDHDTTTSSTTVIEQMDTTDSNQVDKMNKDDILKEETELLRKLSLRKKKNNQAQNFILTVDEGTNNQTAVKEPDNLTVELLGTVPRSYAFNGLQDYQYLPMRISSNKPPISILDKLFPLFSDEDSLMNAKVPSFVVPNSMSRVDRPQRWIIKTLDDDNPSETAVAISSSKSLPLQPKMMDSLRIKRIVYTLAFDFNSQDKIFQKNPEKSKVPDRAHPNAFIDASRRGYEVDGSLEKIKQIFQERPIFSKLALEHIIAEDPKRLKYLLPCVSYFANNGPWRSLWIRFGYDPRTQPSSFVYQLFDYRFASKFRDLFKENDNEPIDPLSTYAFKEGVVPARAQMFYQFCDIDIPEINALKENFAHRFMSQKVIPYTAKCGFLEEETFNYTRYCISRHIEQHLLKIGKISVAHLAPIDVNQSSPIKIPHTPSTKKRSKPSRPQPQSQAQRIALTIKKKMNPKKKFAKRRKVIQESSKRNLTDVNAIKINKPLP